MADQGETGPPPSGPVSISPGSAGAAPPYPSSDYGTGGGAPGAGRQAWLPGGHARGRGPRPCLRRRVRARGGSECESIAKPPEFAGGRTGYAGFYLCRKMISQDAGIQQLKQINPKSDCQNRLNLNLFYEATFLPSPAPVIDP